MTIAIYLESYQGNIIKAGKQAAGAALELGKIHNMDVEGILIDQNLEEALEEAKDLGINKIYTKSDVSEYNAIEFAKYIVSVTEDHDYVITPTTIWGHEILGYVAVKSNRNTVTDIIGFSEEGNYHRSIHGNSVISTVSSEGKQALSIRSGEFDIPTGGESDVEIVEIEASADPSPVKLKEITIPETDRPPLEEADRVVAGGRGVENNEKFEELIIGIADILDGGIAATRAIVDDGMRPVDEQVGQTGKTISPQLYIAAGISGAVQHISGMKSSDVIVSINTDEEAPIFDISDYGIVADLHEFLPLLKDKIKSKKD